MISKMERGERRLNRVQVIKLAGYYHVSEERLLTLRVCDRVLDVVENEPFSKKGMQKALKILEV